MPFLRKAKVAASFSSSEADRVCNQRVQQEIVHALVTFPVMNNLDLMVKIPHFLIKTHPQLQRCLVCTSTTTMMLR